jgi:hypothetical protein
MSPSRRLIVQWFVDRQFFESAGFFYVILAVSLAGALTLLGGVLYIIRVKRLWFAPNLV